LIIPKLIAIHQQLLRTVPHLVIAPTFATTIQFVVDAFGHTQRPSTLRHVAAAVEVFGGNNDTQQSFHHLLHHVTTILTKHVTTVNAQDSSNLLQGCFECLQRHVLRCPAGLLSNPQLFGTIMSLAVECLTALNGEKSRLVPTCHSHRKTLWMTRIAIVGSSQSGVSKCQCRSRSVGRSWTHHLSTMRRRFGRWSSNVMARLC
jgi:hypothetical protein